jgi:hypothetical protein
MRLLADLTPKFTRSLHDVAAGYADLCTVEIPPALYVLACSSQRRSSQVSPVTNFVHSFLQNSNWHPDFMSALLAILDATRRLFVTPAGRVDFDWRVRQKPRNELGRKMGSPTPESQTRRVSGG